MSLSNDETQKIKVMYGALTLQQLEEELACLREARYADSRANEYVFPYVEGNARTLSSCRSTSGEFLEFAYQLLQELARAQNAEVAKKKQMEPASKATPEQSIELLVQRLE